MKFELPQLPYAYKDLEPHIDAQTVEIHYDRHHRGYKNKLNEALEKHPEFAEGLTIEQILKNVGDIPTDIRQAVINTGGGYANHNLYWSILTPNGKGKPSGKLLEAIEKAFGSFDTFKEKFDQAAKTLFGSGWAFLVVNASKELEIVSLGNQDSPLSIGKTPIMLIDVWEHAYYLNYQNKRPDYVNALWNIYNWDQIEKNYLDALN